MKRLGLLDRYVLGTWLKIFVLTALGFPLVSVMIQLTDELRRLLDRGLGWQEILLGYVFSLPENIFLVMPAAVLFASVFTVGSLGRYSELTAAKASGVSLHRISLPIYLAAAGAALLAAGIGELAPGTTARQIALHEAKEARSTTYRYNFVYRADAGWVFTIGSLDLGSRALRQPVLERQGNGLDYPDLIVAADSATYDDSLRAWRLWNGTSRLVTTGRQSTFQFAKLRLRALSQTPADLLAEPKAPEEMRYAELGRYIDALRRSGNDANKLVVEQALKLALPAACLVIALFGAPLGVTSPRAGAAVGIAISLGTTVVYLLLIQISKAVGQGGVIDPVLAAWLPNVLFLGVAVGLLQRART